MLPGTHVCWGRETRLNLIISACVLRSHQHRLPNGISHVTRARNIPTRRRRSSNALNVTRKAFSSRHARYTLYWQTWWFSSVSSRLFQGNRYIQCLNLQYGYSPWKMFMTNKCTIISQIITLLHVPTLSCHPQGACNQYLAKLHRYFKCSCWCNNLQIRCCT